MPANSISGVPEVLHQLCFALRNRCINAYMLYTPIGVPIEDKNAYADYHCPYVSQIIDQEQNILIVNEIFTFYLDGLEKTCCIIWWLSVDYWFKYTINELFQFSSSISFD